jgi:hypothetical protein
MNRHPEVLLAELGMGMTLHVDNDMCYTSDPNDEDKGQSHDFGPRDLAYIFGGILGFEMEEV